MKHILLFIKLIRMRRDDVRIHVRERIVQIHVQRTAVHAVATVAAEQRLSVFQVPCYSCLSCVYGGGIPPFPLIGFAYKGCSQESDATMYEYTSANELFKDTDSAPQLMPKPRLPPNSAYPNIASFQYR